MSFNGYLRPVSANIMVKSAARSHLALTNCLTNCSHPPSSIAPRKQTRAKFFQWVKTPALGEVLGAGEQ
ncbi:MAG: hypothetical protein HC780_16480 [Leptolyngbyaceae cyanobacterium CSU_1_3]|nr:hypothetical protein [Leptolyngbyaceae cyanobacterium CSU_1_3]